MRGHRLALRCPPRGWDPCKHLTVHSGTVHSGTGNEMSAGERRAPRPAIPVSGKVPSESRPVGRGRHWTGQKVEMSEAGGQRSVGCVGNTGAGFRPHPGGQEGGLAVSPEQVGGVPLGLTLQAPPSLRCPSLHSADLWLRVLDPWGQGPGSTPLSSSGHGSWPEASARGSGKDHGRQQSCLSCIR